MSQDIRDLATPSCELLALGEPTHLEPAFGLVRNDLFVQLVDRGFRSIALETDRVAALAVNDFVQNGVGTLAAAMSEGFSHGWGALEPNRHLVAWMHDHNENLPPEERVAFHGFDVQGENTSAHSPRRYLEHVRDYLKIDLDVQSLIGDDERWSRDEAILNPAMSPGATPEAERLRFVADDLLDELHARAPELIAATSRADWLKAETHMTAAISLLRYHRQSAQQVDESVRLTSLVATRDVIQARNLMDIRRIEAERGPTLVFAHNLHLQRNRGTMRVADVDVHFFPSGAIVASLLGERYKFVAGSLGRSEAVGLPEPEEDTYEGLLQRRITSVTSARTRSPRFGYFPLEPTTLDGSEAVLHISDGGQPSSASISRIFANARC